MHFASDGEGGYSVDYPADRAEAVLLLEAAIDRGSACLVVPERSDWWLDPSRTLALHLDTHGDLVAGRADIGTVYFGATQPSRSREQP
jgi:hypothetical protein